MGDCFHTAEVLAKSFLIPPHPPFLCTTLKIYFKNEAHTQFNPFLCHLISSVTIANIK